MPTIRVPPVIVMPRRASSSRSRTRRRARLEERDVQEAAWSAASTSTKSMPLSVAVARGRRRAAARCVARQTGALVDRRSCRSPPALANVSTRRSLADAAPVGDGDLEPLSTRLDLDVLDLDLRARATSAARPSRAACVAAASAVAVRHEDERLQPAAEVRPVDPLARAREEHLEDQVADVVVLAGRRGAPAAVEVEREVEVAARSRSLAC